MPNVAHAYEDQLTFGVGAGYALSPSDALPKHGALLDLSVSAGLGPEFSLRGRATYAFYPESSPLHAAVLGGELLYLVDVVEVVPYCGIGVDGLLRAAAADSEVDAAAHVVLGVDYLASRELTLGLDLRPMLILTDLDRAPLMLALTASVVFMFDK